MSTQGRGPAQNIGERLGSEVPEERDAVCGMTVRPDSPNRLQHAGSTYRTVREARRRLESHFTTLTVVVR